MGIIGLTMESLPRRTKLERRYYGTRFVSVLTRYEVFFGIAVMLVGIAPLLVPILYMMYFIGALFLSLLLVIGTLFLIFLTVGQPDNPLTEIWSGFDHFDQVINAVTEFGKFFCPIGGGVIIILDIVLLILVSKNWGRSSQGKDKAALIASIIMCGIGILSSLLMGVIMK